MYYPPPPSDQGPGSAPPQAQQPGHYPPPPSQSQGGHYPPPPQQAAGHYPPPPAFNSIQHAQAAPPYVVAGVDSQKGTPPMQFQSPPLQQPMPLQPVQGTPGPNAQQTPPNWSSPTPAGKGKEQGGAQPQEQVQPHSYPDEKAELKKKDEEISNLKQSFKNLMNAPKAENFNQENFVGAQTINDDVGTFNGGSYRISHRDTNSILTVQLAAGCPLWAKPGALVSMSPTVTVKGQMNLGFKKLLMGSVASTSLTGPGEVILAPPFLGDVVVLTVTPKQLWKLGNDSFLGSTAGVNKETETQSLSKAVFSGEGMFIYKMTGQGLVWATSFGAIIRKDLQAGEKYVIDNGHLVAWDCEYVLQRVASGGILSNTLAGEGLVCRFQGPGTIYFQTRNPRAFARVLGLSAAK